MKESFVLTISPRYVPDWGKWEAFRELMQNSIDRENEQPISEIIFTYNPTQQRITIGNKRSALDRKTLILGEGDKANNEDAIGKYGEGYKLALLVFLRLGTRIRIRNLDEVWAPKIKYSDQFQTDLLTIEAIKTKPTDNLLFELDGITDTDYREFKKNCLYLNPPAEKITTSKGDILLDEGLRSKVFVEGLFVYQFPESDKIRYGYDMKARWLNLDRDRRKIESFNVLWEVAQMYASLDSTYANLIYNLEKEEWRDIDYLSSHRRGKGNPLYDALCTMHYADFLAKYGKHAIPVGSEQEADFIKEKYNNLMPVLLKTTKYRYVTDSASYSTSTKGNIPKEETPYSLSKAAIIKFKEARDVMLKEFLPMTKNWCKRYI